MSLAASSAQPPAVSTRRPLCHTSVAYCRILVANRYAGRRRSSRPVRCSRCTTREKGMTHLFHPLRLRQVTLRNRVVVAPMWQYASPPSGSGCATQSMIQRTRPNGTRRGLRNLHPRTTRPAAAPKPVRPAPGRPFGARNRVVAQQCDVGRILATGEAHSTASPPQEGTRSR